MKRWLAGSGIVLACLAVGLVCGCNGNNVVPPEGKVFTATPTFDLPGGLYATPVSVEITSATAGAKIYYSIDGSDPSDTKGTLYSSPIHVEHSMTIRAAAYSDSALPSIIGEAVYTIAGNAPPVVSNASVAGKLLPGQIGQVTVTCTAMDPDGYVAAVIVDLSPVGGVAAQPLSKGTGNQWAWSGRVEAGR